MNLTVINDQNRVIVEDDGNVIVVEGNPTVTVQDVGPQGPAGVGADGYLLQAYDTTDQTAADTTTAYPIKLGTVDISNGITVANNGSGDPTRITFANDGDYNVQFSIQFQNSSASEAEANVWFKKNGNDVSNSNSQCTVPKKHGADNGSLLLAANLIVSASTGDYVELYWQTESTSISIETLAAGTTPTTPVTPGVIVTASVNRYLEVGPTGPTGPGVATGGTTGQVLAKKSATNYDTEWINGGLRLIKTVTVGSGVATVVLDNVFNSTFDTYRITLNNIVGSVTFQTTVRLKLGSVTSAYYGGFYALDYAGGTATVLSNNASVCNLCYLLNTKGSNASFDITSPHLTERTSWTGTWNDGGQGGYLFGSQYSNTSFTDFTLVTASGTMTGGTISVYGYCQ